MYMRRVSVDFTADASGNVTVYSPQVSGRLMSVIYTKGTAAAGTDIVISTKTTGVTALTLTDIAASAAFHPRVVNHGNTGTALTGVEPVNVADEEIKVVVAQAGNGGTGTLTFVVG